TLSLHHIIPSNVPDPTEISTLSLHDALPILITEKLISIAENTPYRNVTDQPLFFIALVAIIVGTQLFLTGFIAEMISRSTPDRKSEEHTSELQSRENLVCRLLLEKKNKELLT